MEIFEINLFLIYYLSCLWCYKGYSSQNFTFILVWKINKKINNYNKSKNEGLTMLTMNFENIIVRSHINKGLIVRFTLILIYIWNSQMDRRKSRFTNKLIFMCFNVWIWVNIHTWTCFSDDYHI